MKSTIRAKFTVTKWDEDPFDEAVGVAKLTRAVVSKDYTGDVQGSSSTTWLMAYEPDKSATFVGLERIKGTVAGLHGSLVVQHVGRFEDGAATADLTIVSGTNELKGASGSGSFTADPAGSIELSIEVDASA